VREPSATLSVRLRPRAGRDALEGWRYGVLQARVAAPPVGGKANRALCRLVAGERVAPSRVTLVRGERGREKVLRVEGVDAAGVRERLGGP
jgi:uncharacterized protein (TIGR00251 family)